MADQARDAAASARKLLRVQKRQVDELGMGVLPSAARIDLSAKKKEELWKSVTNAEQRRLVNNPAYAAYKNPDTLVSELIPAPKKPMSSYMLYVQDLRIAANAKNQKVSVTELTKNLKWNEVDAATAEKYNKLAEAARQEFVQATALYQQLLDVQTALVAAYQAAGVAIEHPQKVLEEQQQKARGVEWVDALPKPVIKRIIQQVPGWDTSISPELLSVIAVAVEAFIVHLGAQLAEANKQAKRIIVKPQLLQVLAATQPNLSFLRHFKPLVELQNEADDEKAEKPKKAAAAAAEKKAPKEKKADAPAEKKATPKKAEKAEKAEKKETPKKDKAAKAADKAAGSGNVAAILKKQPKVDAAAAEKAAAQEEAEAKAAAAAAAKPAKSKKDKKEKAEPAAEKPAAVDAAHNDTPTKRKKVHDDAQKKAKKSKK